MKHLKTLAGILCFLMILLFYGIAGEDSYQRALNETGAWAQVIAEADARHAEAIQRGEHE